jgi:hydroxyacylglutathione hydrolase
VSTAKPIVVHCASGWRSSVAASLLREHGFENVADLAGGYNAWVRAGASRASRHETVTPALR